MLDIEQKNSIEKIKQKPKFEDQSIHITTGALASFSLYLFNDPTLRKRNRVQNKTNVLFKLRNTYENHK